MRIRSIKPEFWRSDDITSLPVEDRLLFIGLWSYVDDNGVGRDDEAAITADLFARDMFRNPRETVARVTEGLERLSSSGLIDRYTVAGRGFLYVTTWEHHQRVDKPNKPRYPGPDQADQPIRDALATSSRESREIPAPGTEEQGSRGTEEQTSTSDEVEVARNRATRIPDPFLVTHDMRAWAAEEVPTVDVDAATRMFVDHFRAAAGRNATKRDWLATWRNWLRRDAGNPRSSSNGGVRESSIDRRTRQVDQMFKDLTAVTPLRAIGGHE